MTIALEELHKLGHIHSDIKPDNICISEWNIDGFHSNLIDFGLSKNYKKTKKSDSSCSGDLRTFNGNFAFASHH